jgi:hypothetical protein
VSFYGLALQLRSLTAASTHLTTAADYLTDHAQLQTTLQHNLSWLGSAARSLDVTGCTGTTRRLSSGALPLTGALSL